MTVSETREMYTLDAALFFERREKARACLLAFLNLLPWAASAYVLVASSVNAVFVALGVLMVLGAYLSMKKVKSEGSLFSGFWSAFSFLVLLFFILTSCMR